MKNHSASKQAASIKGRRRARPFAVSNLDLTFLHAEPLNVAIGLSIRPGAQVGPSESHRRIRFLVKRNPPQHEISAGAITRLIHETLHILMKKAKRAKGNG